MTSNSVIPQLKQQAKEFIQTASRWAGEYRAVLVSFLLAILSGWFFLIIGYPNLFSDIPFFRQRWFGLGILACSLLITYFLSFHSRWSITRSLFVWVQSNLLLFFSFAYYLRLNNSELAILGQRFTTGWIFIPLALLIFLVNYDLFGPYRRPFWYLLPQILLFTLHTFSFLGFIGADRTFVRDFSQDWLSSVFSLPVVVWLALAASAVAFSSFMYMQIAKPGHRLLYALVLFLLSGQLFASVYFLELSYWYQTLLTLVVWDFLYTPLKSLATGVFDAKYKPRLMVSMFYHAMLFGLILILR